MAQIAPAGRRQQTRADTAPASGCVNADPAVRAPTLIGAHDERAHTHRWEVDRHLEVWEAALGASLHGKVRETQSRRKARQLAVCLLRRRRVAPVSPRAGSSLHRLA